VAIKSKTNPNASRLTAHIGFWMRRVSNQVSHAFARKLEASGVTVAEWVVLREMYGGDETTSPSVVAELTGLTRGAVSKLISRLLEKGLVSRKESASDRRYQDIELTRNGVALVPRLARLADENDEDFFGVLSSSDRKTLTRLLKKTAALHHLTQMPIEWDSQMNEAIIRELVDKALAKEITFPEILGMLGKNGVESYHVDLLRNEFRCYTRNGGSLVTSVPLVHDGVAPAFSPEKLEIINKRVQSGEWSFADFVRESTAAAGCAYYIVYLNGKKVRYFGRDGDEHVQLFPGSR